MVTIEKSRFGPLVILEELLMFIHPGGPHHIFPAAFFSFGFFFRS
jgi:hypothetical protein